jgi:hypothetical protein
VLEDEQLPMTFEWEKQVKAVLDTLTNVRSPTARTFTRQEQAQNHVHDGNFGRSLNVILNWLDSM